MKGTTETKPKNVSRHSWMKSLRLAAKKVKERKRRTGLTLDA